MAVCRVLAAVEDVTTDFLEPVASGVGSGWRRWTGRREEANALIGLLFDCSRGTLGGITYFLV